MAIEACGGNCPDCQKIMRGQVRAALAMLRPELREQVARDALDELGAADAIEARRD